MHTIHTHTLTLPLIYPHCHFHEHSHSRKFDTHIHTHTHTCRIWKILRAKQGILFTLRPMMGLVSLNSLIPCMSGAREYERQRGRQKEREMRGWDHWNFWSHVWQVRESAIERESVCVYEHDGGGIKEFSVPMHVRCGRRRKRERTIERERAMGLVVWLHWILWSRAFKVRRSVIARKTECVCIAQF